MSLATIPEAFLHSQNIFCTIIGMDGSYLNANRYFLDEFGLTQEQLLEYDYTKTMHAEDVELCSKAVHWCVENPGKPYPLLLRKKAKYSRLLFTKWEFTYLNQYDTNEAIVRCIGVDITTEILNSKAIKYYQQEIVSKEKIFESLFSNSIDIVTLLDKEGVITYISPNIENWMGYKAEEMIGRNCFAYVHPEDLEKTWSTFNDEIQNPNNNDAIDVRFLKKDGTWMWAVVKGKNLLDDPDVKSVLVNLNEIGQRKRAEQALLESENKYRTFFEYLPHPIFLVNPETFKIESFNRKASETYAYSQEELLRMNYADLLKEKPLYGQFISKFIHESSQQQISKNGTYISKFIHESSQQHLTKNGDVLYVNIEQHAMDLDGKSYRMILVHDVTESFYYQQESQLSYDVSNILIENTPLYQNLTTALNKIRNFADWDLIELWMPVYDHSSIRNDLSEYNPQNPKADLIRGFISRTRMEEYKRDRYAETPAYKNLKPFWIEDLAADNSLVRKKMALESEFKSVLSIPVLNEGKVVCSIYLFSFSPKRRVERIEKLISIVGSLIGTEIQKRKKEMVLDRFFSISSDIMTIAGLDGRYIRVNPAFEMFCGYTEQEAHVLHPLHYVHPDDRKDVLKKLLELTSGHSVNYFENRIVTKSGIVKWIAWTATPILEEGMVIASHRDITQQKTAEAELKLSNERYRLVSKAMTNEAIWDYDIIGNAITRSEGFMHLFGYTNLKDDASMGFWEEHLHPDDKKRASESIRLFLQQTESHNWQCEYRFRKQDGSYANIIDRGYMILDKESHPVRVVGAMEDISDRVKLEEELILEERNRQKQIAQAAVDAQEKERADIGKELHDNVSQMLTTTRLLLDLVQKKYQDQMLEQCTKNVNEIIREIRNVSRSLVPSNIDDVGLVAAMNDLFAIIRMTNVLEIEFYSDPEIENLLSVNSKLTLYRIVQENVNNVIKHANAKSVVVELFSEKDNVDLIMTDDGKGFEYESVKKGLGLKNMMSRAEMLGGAVSLKSKPGDGCKLTVSIPINQRTN